MTSDSSSSTIFTGPGEEQQITGQLLDAGHVGQGFGDEVGCLSHPEFEPGAQRGDGVAQFVGGVGDELLVPIDRELQLAQGDVHGPGEACDLVAGDGLGHPAVEVLGGDVGEGGPDRFHGGEHPAHQLPCHDGHQHHQRRYTHQEQLLQHTEGVADGGQRDAAFTVTGPSMVSTTVLAVA
ncbi:hypothetical protein WB401_08130 [Streptomyces brasiliscabiei]|uniref:Uncharacterized protein n=1 Tax=Streptomyces brasiliscabiei TaxID=2736302 RepID=A0ABU8G6J7_9ACTN